MDAETGLVLVGRVEFRSKPELPGSQWHGSSAGVILAFY